MRIKRSFLKIFAAAAFVLWASGLTALHLRREPSEPQFQFSPHSHSSEADYFNSTRRGGHANANWSPTRNADPDTGSSGDGHRPGNKLDDGNFSKFIVIGANDSGNSAKQRQDLELCFGSLCVSNQSCWEFKARRENERIKKTHITCDIEGIGTFQITKCLRHTVCVIESLDEEDYGTRYFMKMGSPGSRSTSENLFQEAEIVHYLSHSNQSRNLTAKPHPRYPFVRWKMMNNKADDVAVLILEQLELSHPSFKKLVKSRKTVADVLSGETVQCWEDVLSVTKTLFEFRGGHYIHDDIHYGQVLSVKSGDNRLRCYLIDFGLVNSLDQTKIDLRMNFANPFWYMNLRNWRQRSDFVREHGLDQFHRRGWEFSLSRWGHQIFLERLVEMMYGSDPFPIRDDEDKETIVVAKWCQTTEIVKSLVEKIEKLRKEANNGTRLAISDAAFSMVVEQSTIIENGVAVAMNCSDYKAVLKSQE